MKVRLWLFDHGYGARLEDPPGKHQKDLLLTGPERIEGKVASDWVNDMHPSLLLSSRDRPDSRWLTGTEEASLSEESLQTLLRQRCLGSRGSQLEVDQFLDVIPSLFALARRRSVAGGGSIRVTPRHRARQELSDEVCLKGDQIAFPLGARPSIRLNPEFSENLLKLARRPQVLQPPQPCISSFSKPELCVLDKKRDIALAGLKNNREIEPEVVSRVNRLWEPQQAELPAAQLQRQLYTHTTGFRAVEVFRPEGKMRVRLVPRKRDPTLSGVAEFHVAAPAEAEGPKGQSYGLEEI